jgi:hypothetical protein
LSAIFLICCVRLHLPVWNCAEFIIITIISTCSAFIIIVMTM